MDLARCTTRWLFKITTFRLRPIPAGRQPEAVAISQPFDLVVPGRIDSEAKVQKKTG
jgi:hypothetical protein